MKNKPITIIIITLVIIAGIIAFLIYPVVSSVMASYKDLNQSKENLKTIQEKKQVFEALQNNKNLNKIADIAQNYIPKDQESSQLIIELTAIAQANKLTIEQTSIEKSKSEPTPKETTEGSASKSPTPATSASPKDTGAKTINFTMKISGSYNDFINFLKGIETSSRLTTINNISMQVQTQKDQPSTFSVQLSGTAYYKSDISLENTLDNIKISDETMQKFLNLKSYGQPINLPSESGFGRQNPFEGY